VLDLTEESHGNAIGVGLADFTTTRLVKAMNYRATVVNCLTAGYPDGAFLPVHFETDREVMDAALAIIGTRPLREARILRIRNTLDLEEVEASEPCFAAPPRTDVTPIGAAYPLTFDERGNLSPLGTVVD